MSPLHSHSQIIIEVVKNEQQLTPLKNKQSHPDKNIDKLIRLRQGQLKGEEVSDNE